MLLYGKATSPDALVWAFQGRWRARLIRRAGMRRALEVRGLLPPVLFVNGPTHHSMECLRSEVCCCGSAEDHCDV